LKTQGSKNERGEQFSGMARSAIDRSLVGPDKSATVLILAGKGTAQEHKRNKKDY